LPCPPDIKPTRWQQQQQDCLCLLFSRCTLHSELWTSFIASIAAADPIQHRCATAANPERKISDGSPLASTVPLSLKTKLAKSLTVLWSAIRFRRFGAIVRSEIGEMGDFSPGQVAVVGTRRAGRMVKYGGVRFFKSAHVLTEDRAPCRSHVTRFAPPPCAAGRGLGVGMALHGVLLTYRHTLSVLKMLIDCFTASKAAAEAYSIINTFSGLTNPIYRRGYRTAFVFEAQLFQHLRGFPRKRNCVR
jgi:hypothetical protein